MSKKLPNIFACKVNSDGNNVDVFYGEKDTDNDIYKKIDNIFSSSDYIYKADVIISLKNGNITRRVIGRNRNNLITIDNELIPIDNILNIEKK